VAQAGAGENMSLDKAAPTLKKLLGRDMILSSKYLFDFFLAEQPRLRGKISEPGRGWCPWLEAEAYKGTAEKTLKQEAEHMCRDSIRVWNEYVERKGEEYPNVANASRITEDNLLCGAFDLRQSLKYCGATGLVVRVTGFMPGGSSADEFADISKDETPIFLSASVINQKHSVTAGDKDVGIMFEKEETKDREIVVLAGGQDLWLRTDWKDRKKAELDVESMTALQNQFPRRNANDHEGKAQLAAFKHKVAVRRLTQLKTQLPHTFLKKALRICVNKSWLEEQGWEQSEWEQSETQTQNHDSLFPLVLDYRRKQQVKSNCRYFKKLPISIEGAIELRQPVRSFSENESGALEFALSDAVRLFNERKKKQQKEEEESKEEQKALAALAGLDLTGVALTDDDINANGDNMPANVEEKRALIQTETLYSSSLSGEKSAQNPDENIEVFNKYATRDSFNEVMVDVTAQNVHAIWLMESQWSKKTEGNEKTQSMKRAQELFGAYVKKFDTHPLFVRIFAQAGAVFRLPPPLAENPTRKFLGQAAR